MDGSPLKSQGFSHAFLWVPEFLDLLRKGSWAQSRLAGACLLVGVVAGLGAVVFTIACQFVVRWSLDEVVGYRAAAPLGEAKVNWIGESDTPFQPWLLLLVPTVGGLVSGWLVFTFAPEAE